MPKKKKLSSIFIDIGRDKNYTLKPHLLTREKEKENHGLNRYEIMVGPIFGYALLKQQYRYKYRFAALSEGINHTKRLKKIITTIAFFYTNNCAGPKTLLNFRSASK